MLRCEKRRSPCLRFLIVSFRARPLLLLPSRPVVSLSPPSSGVRPPPSPPCNVTSTVHLRTLRYLPVCSSTPRVLVNAFHGRVLGLHRYRHRRPRSRRTRAPRSPGIEFRALSPLVNRGTRGGMIFLERMFELLEQRMQGRGRDRPIVHTYELVNVVS